MKKESILLTLEFIFCSITLLKSAVATKLPHINSEWCRKMCKYLNYIWRYGNLISMTGQQCWWVRPTWNFAQFILEQSPNASKQDFGLIQTSWRLSCVCCEDPDSENILSSENNRFKGSCSLGSIMASLSAFYFLSVLCPLALNVGLVWMAHTKNLSVRHSSGSCEIYLEYPFSA